MPYTKEINNSVIQFFSHFGLNNICLQLNSLRFLFSFTQQRLNQCKRDLLTFFFSLIALYTLYQIAINNEYITKSHWDINLNAILIDSEKAAAHKVCV